MNNEKSINSKQGLFLKILISIIFIIAVINIWTIMNNKSESDSAVVNKSDSAVATSSERSKTKVTANSDFELYVTEKIDIDKLKAYGLPIIIDFGAASNTTCKELAPVLEELNAELEGRAIVKFVDIQKYRELVQGYPIDVIPTQIFIDASGKPYVPKDPRSLKLKQYSNKDTGEHVFTLHEGGLKKEQLLNVLKEMGLN